MRFFPNWEALDEHKEVIRFAIGLTDETHTVLDHVYHVIQWMGLKNPISRYYAEFLHSLWREAYGDTIVDPLHNRFLNASMRPSEDDVPEICIPSKRYVISGLGPFQVNQPLLSRDVLPAEGILRIWGNHEFFEVTELLQKVREHQKVIVKGLCIEDLDRCEDIPDDVTCSLLDILESRLYNDRVLDDNNIQDFLHFCMDIIKNGDDKNEIAALLIDVLTIAPKNIAQDESIQVICDIILRLHNVSDDEDDASGQDVCVNDVSGDEVDSGDEVNSGDEDDDVSGNDSSGDDVSSEYANGDDFYLKGDMLLTDLFFKLDIDKELEVVIMKECILSESLFAYITKQLHGCNKLRELSISWSVEINSSLGEALATMTSLRKVKLSGAPQSLGKALVCGLSNCHLLEKVTFQNCILTDCVGGLFGNRNHPGFTSLTCLKLQQTKLSSKDLVSISKAISRDTLPALENLDISDNLLTNCLIHLFSNFDHIGQQHLKDLNLSHTGLSRSDLKSVSSAVQACKLPKLKYLNLSENILTNNIRELVGGPNHPGFRSLEYLDLHKSKLSTADWKYLLAAIHDDKFPCLDHLPHLPEVLTDLLDDIFRINSHQAFPFRDIYDIFSRGPRQKVQLQMKELSKGDLRSICQAIKDGKLNELVVLDLSFNTVRDFFADLLYCQHPSLEVLKVKNAQLSEADINCLAEKLGCGILPRLKLLDLSDNVLTDNLTDLFSTNNQTLEDLFVRNTHLSKTDVNGLAEAIQRKRISRLQQLDLSLNTLTDSFSNLFHCEYPNLEKLQVSNSQLSKADIRSIAEAVGEDKVRSLKHLDISGNTITDSLKELLSVEHLVLEELKLNNAELSRADLSSVSEAVTSGRLPKLRDLYLSGNSLTNSLNVLLGSISTLEGLFIRNTHVNGDDLASLTDAMSSEKLPKLVSLDLAQNNLRLMEKDVENLVQACVEFRKDRGLSVELGHNDLRKNFLGKLRSSCGLRILLGVDGRLFY